MDYSKLTDAELDAKVAEAMGWTCIYGESRKYGMPPGSRYGSNVPYYSTDIGAAWGLVEMMTTTDQRVVIRNRFQWCKVELHTSEDMPAQENAPTAPRAICLAFLAWKERG